MTRSTTPATHRSPLARPLLRWYARHARVLPWRGSRDPYRVWTAEIMLQQTRVEAVRPYYVRFLRRFPSAGRLAAAPLADVLKAWEGMGYYSRARNLHRAAKTVVREWGGSLPQTAEELRRLPGIGRYTAGAIASIAFGRDEPVLDGNVSRVLCRLLCIRSDPRRPATRERLWSAARGLLPRGRAGDFNQALMDLGATVCVPGRPRCGDCPVAALCEGRRAGLEESLPVRRRRMAIPHRTIVVGVIRRGGRILIARRRDEGLLGGLWEFPGGKVEPGETPEQALRREVREETGASIRVLRPMMTIGHAYSHFRITMHVMECRHLAGRPRPLACAEVRWARPADLDRYAWPAANRRIIQQLENS